MLLHALIGAGGGHGIDPLAMLVMALLIDVYVGEMPMVFSRVRHPVVLLGDLIAILDRRLNRETRSERDRLARGFFTVAVVTGVAGAVGGGMTWLSLNVPHAWILEVLLTVTLVAQRALYDHVHAVAKALAFEGVESGRRAVRHIVGRDVTRLDEAGVARAAIESCAENYNDGIVAPVFWYLLFGLPGLLVYKAVNTMDSMIGHLTPRHRAFGKAAARLDDGLNWIPARLAGLFIVLAALFVPTGRPLKSLKVMLRDAGHHRSPNAGWPEGAMAGALDLALAGPRTYASGTVEDHWIGDGTHAARAGDVRRALYMFVVACLVNGVWVAAIAVIHLGLGLGHDPGISLQDFRDLLWFAK